jgi:hypothetical protein
MSGLLSSPFSPHRITGDGRAHVPRSSLFFRDDTGGESVKTYFGVSPACPQVAMRPVLPKGEQVIIKNSDALRLLHWVVTWVLSQRLE